KPFSHQLVSFGRGIGHSLFHLLRFLEILLGSFSAPFGKQFVPRLAHCARLNFVPRGDKVLDEVLDGKCFPQLVNLLLCGALAGQSGSSSDVIRLEALDMRLIHWLNKTRTIWRHKDHLYLRVILIQVLWMNSGVVENQKGLRFFVLPLQVHFYCRVEKFIKPFLEQGTSHPGLLAGTKNITEL